MKKIFVGQLLAVLIALSCNPVFAGSEGYHHRERSYLLVWSSDQGTDDGVQNGDFLAVIDANPRSKTYGKVINTAALPCIPNANLLDEIGLAPGTSSCVLNEAHHMSEEIYVDPKTRRKYLFAAGLVSANIFRFDVTDPLNIPTAELIVDSRELAKFSGADDILFLPNGNLIASYMGSKGLTTPGGLVEFTPDGIVVGEYDAAKPGGPVRYAPSINGITDTGLLAHPHGIALRDDLDVLISSDFADPISLATSSAANMLQDFGTTVRVWKLSNLLAGPTKIIQVPNGPRVEQNAIHEEPEGLMAAGLLHRKKNKGAFTASMCGGALFYTSDITSPNPAFKQVYDAGPCTGASVFKITENDRFMLIPVAGIQSPGDTIFDRDYPGEHARRVIVLDIRPLTRKGTGPIDCGPPSVVNDPVTGFTTSFVGHNNGASDCPVEVGVLNVDSALNFSSHGGPHSLQLDDEERRFSFSNYFVDLQGFGLPGTGTSGDLKVFMANFNRHNGHASIDTAFRDELTNETGVNFNRPTSYNWPGARGQAGSAKPHAMIFVKTKRMHHEDDD